MLVRVYRPPLPERLERIQSSAIQTISSRNINTMAHSCGTNMGQCIKALGLVMWMDILRCSVLNVDPVAGWLNGAKSLMAPRLVLPTSYLTSSSSESTFNWFPPSVQHPSLITMVITPPLWLQVQSTCVPDNRLWAKSICSITQKPLWPFKHFVSLLIVLHQSIPIQCYLCLKLPRASPHFKWLFVCLETNWPCNRIYPTSNYGLLNNLWLTCWDQSGPKGIRSVSGIQVMKRSALFHVWFDSDTQV